MKKDNPEGAPDGKSDMILTLEDSFWEERTLILL